MKNSKLKTKNLTFCIAILIFTFFILHFNCFAADQLTITTYYPSPYGVYNTLRLYPISAPASCTPGELYYDTTAGIVKYCDNSSVWQAMGGGYWSTVSGSPNSIYNTNSGEVGIGTTVAPKLKLEVMGGIRMSSGHFLMSDGGIYNNALFVGESTATNGFIFRVATSLDAYNASNPATYTDRVWIKPSGEVGIGTASPDVKLDVDGDIEADLISAGGAAVGYIAGGANGGTFKLTRLASSRKYKKNIADFTPGLDIVKKLRPVIFNWKSTGEQDFGFVAEEAEEVNPLLITKINGQVESFRYMPYTAILTNAIKEQQKEIENLKSAVAELSKKLEANK